MEGNKYAMKGYSAYTHIPALGYDDGLQNFINPTYVPSNHYESYERKHGVNQYSSRPKFHNEDIRPGVNQYSARPNLNNDKIRPIKTSFFLSPDDYGPLSQVHGYHSEEAHLVRSEPGFKGRRQVRTSKTVPGPDKSWESATPPPTNNINEALDFLEYANYSRPLDQGKNEYFINFQPVHTDKYLKRETSGLLPGMRY